MADTEWDVVHEPNKVLLRERVGELEMKVSASDLPDGPESPFWAEIVLDWHPDNEESDPHDSLTEYTAPWTFGDNTPDWKDRAFGDLTRCGFSLEAVRGFMDAVHSRQAKVKRDTMIRILSRFSTLAEVEESWKRQSSPKL